MSLTNPNTPVSQQDLKDLYEQKILPYIGGAFGLVATGIDSANLYSTTERVIGQWIDGKPLYQKTIQATIPTAQGTPTDVSIGASVDTVVDANTMFATGNGGFIQTPVINGALSGSVRLSVYNNSYTVASLQNKFRLEQLSGTAVMGGSSCYVTIQYTKTTDSAVDSYGTDTTYSTDEHVVGSWIDGKPLYQKTINTGALPNATTKNVAHGISNLGFVVSLIGYAKQSSGTPVYINFPFVSELSADKNIKLIVSGANISIQSQNNYSGFTESYVTIQYTKSS